MQEGTLPWQPIPERFNFNSMVDVYHIEARHQSLALVVAASRFLDWKEEPEEMKAWRIRFNQVPAYRRRLLNYSPTSTVTWPDPDHHFAAFWEIAPSAFFEESGVLTNSPPPRYHHYVICFGIHYLFEVIADTWDCIELSDEWATPFGPSNIPLLLP